MLKAIYYSRVIMFCIPCIAAMLLIGSIVTWPREQETGEEHLVLQRELDAVQERNRDIQDELRAEARLMRNQIAELQVSQIKMEEFRQRIEEKFDSGMRVLWAICSLLIMQVIIPLMKIGLRRELERIKAVNTE